MAASRFRPALFDTIDNDHAKNPMLIAQRNISHFLMHRYNWVRPHQFNGGLAPARAEEKLYVVSGIS